MKAELKDLGYYEALPYAITIRRDEDGDFVARIPELPGCIAHGDNEVAAIQCLRSVQRLWIEEALSAGIAIAEPENDDPLPSGKWVQRVPRTLHRSLARAAKEDNVSLNQLVTSMLSQALTEKVCGQSFQSLLTHALHISSPIHTHQWWGLPQYAHSQDEEQPWSSPMRYCQNLIQGLDVVKRGKRDNFFQTYPLDANEHTTGRKQLTQK